MDWPNRAPFAAAITFDMEADGLIHAAGPEVSQWALHQILKQGCRSDSMRLQRPLSAGRPHEDGHAVRYLGVEIEDALSLSEGIDL